MKHLDVMMDKAKLLAEVMLVVISRLDIQYNFHRGEYEAVVWYTNGEQYRIDENGEAEKIA